MLDWLQLPVLLAGLAGAVLMLTLTWVGMRTRDQRARRTEMILARTNALRAASTIARMVFEARQAMWREAERASSKLRHHPDQ